jgi:hypothetical protein
MNGDDRQGYIEEIRGGKWVKSYEALHKCMRIKS